jgi:hypothetical protein
MKKYKITKIFISELGYLMLQIYGKEKKHFTNYNLGQVDSVIDFKKINIPLNQIEDVKGR